MVEPRLTDSHSDGMCGWVEMTDGRRTERVSWAIDRATDSQSAAMDVARRLLAYTTIGLDYPTDEQAIELRDAIDRLEVAAHNVAVNVHGAEETLKYERERLYRMLGLGEDQTMVVHTH